MTGFLSEHKIEIAAVLGGMILTAILKWRNAKMVEADIIEGNVGTVGKYDVDFKEGKLQVQVTVAQPFGEAGLVVKVDAGYVLDALAKAIPGVIDDAFINVVKAALLPPSMPPIGQ